MTRPITPKDLWELKRVGQPEHVPGTTSVVVPVVEYDDDGKPVSGIHLLERDGTTRRLTSPTRSSSAPSVSPDGSRMAFLGKKGDDPAQVYVMRLDGGEAMEVTNLPLGAAHVAWIPGSDALIVAATLYRDHPSLEGTIEAKEGREGKALPVVTEDRVYRHWKKWLAGGTLAHLFRVDLADGSLTDITPDLDRLITLEDFTGSLTVSPDGGLIYFTLDDYPEPWEHFRFSIHTVPTAGGDVVRVPTGADAVQHYRPRISPDGTTLVYGAQYEHAYYADLVRIVVHHLPTGSEHQPAAGWDRSAGAWEFIDDGSIVFHAEDEAHVKLFTLDLDGGTPMPQTSTGTSTGPQVGIDCFWHRTETMASPAEVAYTCGGHTTIVSGFNSDAMAGFDIRPAEEIRFTGAEDDQIQAFVVFPPGFDESKQWPLLQNVHGGPHNGVMDNWHWRWNPQVMAAAGYVVVSVNFHGSSSFGDAFTRSIRGRWGDQPSVDINAATDHMIGLGYIDPERTAIAGGSYGGYLVSWLTATTDRYKASICHAGVTDLLGQMASDHTEGRGAAMGGLPWEDMDAVQRWSPMAHTHDIVTPTLVIHGELDYRVVITQGLSLYGTLKAKGVPSRLVYYSDEGHWIESHDNAMLWWEEFVGWLDRWVGTEPVTR